MSEIIPTAYTREFKATLFSSPELAQIIHQERSYILAHFLAYYGPAFRDEIPIRYPADRVRIENAIFDGGEIIRISLPEIKSSIYFLEPQSGLATEKVARRIKHLAPQKRTEILRRMEA